MNIAIFDPYLDSLGGGERYMLTIASCLAKDHQVTVFWDEQTILKRAQDKFGLDLSPVHQSKNIFSPAVTLFQKYQISKKYDFLFYLSDGSIPLSFAKKTVLHFQFPVEWVKMNLQIQLKMQRIYKVICNSAYSKSFIDKTFNIQSTVLYPPVPQITPTQTKKENIILTVGRYNSLPEGGSFKKFEVLIDAFKKMVDSGLHKWRFILVISFLPEEKQAVARLARTIKEYPITLATEIDNAELRNLYQKSKIYWHAAGYGEDLIYHPERAEHFGITTVEAMSAGVVPVVINAGGQKEIITDGKNGFVWNTTQELIQHTKELITHDHIWQQISRTAQGDASHFGDAQFCKQLHQIIS